MSLVPLVAERMRELRHRHGLTQEEAAELVGVSLRFYQMIESGRKKQIWLETIERLAAAFNLEGWELLGPVLPKRSQVAQAVPESAVHYRRRGPYTGASKAGGMANDR